VWRYQRLCNTVLTSWWLAQLCSRHVEAKSYHKTRLCADASGCDCDVIWYKIVHVSTITLLLKIIIRLHVSTIDLSSSGLFLSIQSQDALHTLGFHRVYIHGIHQIISFVSKDVTCKLVNTICTSRPLRQRIYRIIHKSLWDFRTRLRNNQDIHGRKEHINR